MSLNADGTVLCDRCQEGITYGRGVIHPNDPTHRELCDDCWKILNEITPLEFDRPRLHQLALGACYRVEGTETIGWLVALDDGSVATIKLRDIGELVRVPSHALLGPKTTDDHQEWYEHDHLPPKENLDNPSAPAWDRRREPRPPETEWFEPAELIAWIGVSVFWAWIWVKFALGDWGW